MQQLIAKTPATKAGGAAHLDRLGGALLVQLVLLLREDPLVLVHVVGPPAPDRREARLPLRLVPPAGVSILGDFSPCTPVF